MSCCGRGKSLQRAGYAGTAPHGGSPQRYVGGRPPAAGTTPQTLNPSRTFEFSGPGAIVVTGPLTGTRYRFAGNGARVAVHHADAPSLAGVPGLKPVR